MFINNYSFLFRKFEEGDFLYDRRTEKMYMICKGWDEKRTAENKYFLVELQTGIQLPHLENSIEMLIDSFGDTKNLMLIKNSEVSISKA